MKRNIKKILISLMLSSATVVSAVGFGVSQNNSFISKTSVESHALANDNTASSNQEGTTYEVNQTPSPSNKYANQITQQELQNLLVPAESSIKFTVVILPVTEANLNQGSLDFLIYEQLKQIDGSYKTSFADATKEKNKSDGNKKSDNNISEDVLNQYEDSNSTKATANNVFSTSKFSNLSNWILKKSYSLKWKSDKEIENFIKSKEDSNLTVDEVWYNLLDNSTLPPLNTSNTRDGEPNTSISVQQQSASSAGDVGLFKVTVTLNNVTKTKDDSQITTDTKYLGGFNVNGVRQEFKLVGNPNIDGATVSEDGLFNVGDGVSTTSTKLKDLTPSEFASPNGGTTALIDLLTQGTGITGLSNKILTLSYGNLTGIELNKKQDNDVQTFAEITKDQVEKESRITNIDTVPNDSDGSLQLVVYYKVFDVYTGQMADEVTTYNFPAGTFKVNPNADKDLFITWKNAESLENMNYSYEVVNEYYKNKDDPEFARIFSNRFLNATDAVKAMPRTVDINYGTVDGTDTNGSLTSSEDNTIKVKLTFPSWGSSGESFTIENVFTLSGYKYGDGTTGTNQEDVLNFQWKSNKNLFDENRSYTELTPSTVAFNLISNNDANNTKLYSTFILGETSQAQNTEISMKPDDSNGTLMVYIRKKDSGSSIINPTVHVYQQLFVGFKKSNNSSDITAFYFPPQSDVSNELLAIPLTSITKTDVINLYLKDVDLFKDRVLTEDNVEIKPVIKDNGDSYLEVKVTIPTFDQSKPGIDISKQTFYTVISGFSTNSYVNNTQFNPPKDLTAVISISSAVTISIILGVTLIALLIKRAGVKAYKKNDELFKKKPKLEQ